MSLGFWVPLGLCQILCFCDFNYVHLTSNCNCKFGIFLFKFCQVWFLGIVGFALNLGVLEAPSGYLLC